MAQIAPHRRWKQALSQPSTPLLETIAGYRNESPRDAAEAAKWYRELVDKAKDNFERGDCDGMFIVRAPGRVNLLGTHIDHRGGRVNPIAVRELVMVCFPRSDGRIRLANANPAYPADDFLIKDLVPDAKVENWADWTLATPSALKAAGLLGNWSSYVRAAAAYFANSWGMRDTLRGFDLFADGQLPQAAGLSSSSALVVGAAYALHVTNGREVDRRVLAEGCGQAEWYVGTRGGSGDQAAITLSRSGHVSHVDFFPMEVDWSPWRPGVSVVVCHSRIHAQKTSNARSIFNERVATYAIALLWIKSVHPEWADKLVHLRDVLHLSISVADTYRLLKALPTRAARPQILSALPNSEEELTKLFTTHDEPAEGYRVRDVCLYGFAECERSQKLAHHLREGDMVGAGLLIDLSHEGDRVTRVDDVGGRVPCDTGADDDDLDGLVEASESDDPDIRAAAELAQQPGGYAASCPELDEIVDIVRTVEGVYGAGLIGAGLGGCVEAIVENDAVDRVREALMEQYYLKLGKEPFIEVMVPVEGVCALSLPVD